jgi:hypothetical protein
MFECRYARGKKARSNTVEAAPALPSISSTSSSSSSAAAAAATPAARRTPVVDQIPSVTPSSALRVRSHDFTNAGVDHNARAPSVTPATTNRTRAVRSGDASRASVHLVYARAVCVGVDVAISFA